MPPQTPPPTQYQAPAPALNASHTGRNMAIVFGFLFFLALGAGGAAGYYQYQQVVGLRADLQQANTDLASSTAKVTELEAMVTRLSCEGTWVNGCQPYEVSIKATPERGVTPLKVTFEVKVDFLIKTGTDVNFVLDFGDGSTTPITAPGIAVGQAPDGLCNRNGECQVVKKVEHTYVSSTTEAPFSARVLKGTESVAGAVVTVTK